MSQVMNILGMISGRNYCSELVLPIKTCSEMCATVIFPNNFFKSVGRYSSCR